MCNQISLWLLLLGFGCDRAHLNPGPVVCVPVYVWVSGWMYGFLLLTARDKHNIPSNYAMLVCSACLLLFLPNCHRLCSNYDFAPCFNTPSNAGILCLSAARPQLIEVFRIGIRSQGWGSNSHLTHPTPGLQHAGKSRNSEEV